MNSESESPLGDAESAVEDPESSLDDAETAVGDPESLKDSAKEPSVGRGRPGRTAAIDRVASRLLVRWGSLLLTASVIAAVGLAACLFVLQYRPDRQLDDAEAQPAIRAASDGAVAALSYSSENMG